MDNRVRLAASSRHGHLALRRVERQQELIEQLHAVRGERIQIGELARHFGVSDRTIARDVERLRLSGVPLTVRQGRGGGISLARSDGPIPIVFDMPEVAALMSSLAVLGPSVTQSAWSAMRKLSEAVDPAHQPSASRHGRTAPHIGRR
jgi:predicted DNA-binding transcriptional regulator YafY